MADSGSKAMDKRPARARYWNRRTLEKRKVRNILNNNQPAKKGGKPMDKTRATLWWNNQRKTRVPERYLTKTA